MTEHHDAGPSTATLEAHDAERLLYAAGRRHSRRRFDGTPAPTEAIAVLERLSAEFQPYPDARFAVLAEAPPALFTGLVGSYGRITGAVSALLFVGSGDAWARDAHVGFTGEAAILEATALGIDTCWIGGAFDRELAARLPGIAEDERVLAISPLGHAPQGFNLTERTMRAMAGAHKRRPIEQIAPTIDETWPSWARSAVEAARIAPSAVNRQPWRFRMEGDALVVAQVGMETPSVTRRLDCGIAMLHATLGAASAGAEGSWTDLAGDDIARFDTESEHR